MDPKILLEHFEWNINHLREILNSKKTTYYRDASLQRFGFTFDQALKSIRAFAGWEDQEIKTPGQCFDHAVQSGWLTKTADWHSAEKDYAIIKEGLSEESADKVYERLQEYCSLFEELRHALSRVT